MASSSGRIWGLIGLFVIVGLSMLLCGCESRSDRGESARPSTRSVDDEPPVTTLGFIVPRTGFLEADVWKQAFRNEASRNGVLAEVVETEAEKQADAIREISQRNISALIIVPDLADPNLPETLVDARGQSVPLVLLDKAVKVEGDPLPTVRFGSIEESARMLVESALEEAKKAGFPPEGPAVILVNGPFDDNGRARVAALRAALREANVSVLPDAVFRGMMDKAAEAIQSTLKQHPEIAIVLAEEDQGARSSVTTRDKDRPDKPYVIAAFGMGRELSQLAKYNALAGLVEFDVDVEMKTAVATALALARGERVEPDIRVEARFTRSSGTEMRIFTRRTPPKNEPGTEEDPRSRARRPLP